MNNIPEKTNYSCEIKNDPEGRIDIFECDITDMTNACSGGGGPGGRGRNFPHGSEYPAYLHRRPQRGRTACSKERFGFSKVRQLLEALPEFISLEEKLMNGVPQILVTIHPMPQWDKAEGEEAPAQTVPFAAESLPEHLVRHLIFHIQLIITQIRKKSLTYKTECPNADQQ